MNFFGSYLRIAIAAFSAIITPSTRNVVQLQGNAHQCATSVPQGLGLIHQRLG